MELGSDYLLVQEKRKRAIRRFWALFLISVGLALVGMAGGYYIYAMWARSNLDRLVVSVPFERPLVMPEDDIRPPVGLGIQVEEPTLPIGANYVSAETSERILLELAPSSGNPNLMYVEGFGTFQPVDWASLPKETGVMPAATRLVVPLIDVDSGIKPLEIAKQDGIPYLETPKWIVGWVPWTNNPGEADSTYLFGHLNSPIRREGNVFQRLPEIATLLKSGQKVTAVVVSADGTAWLYQIIATKVLPGTEMSVENPGEPSLFLVTCVPEFVYDHRFIAEGRLIGKLPPQ